MTSQSHEPADLSAVEARRLIGLKQLSPVELAESCIRRVERVNPAVNALVAHDFDRTMDAARQAEAQVTSGGPLGALHGLPFGVKDQADAAGLPTTFGSRLMADNIATTDSLIVANMRSAGAVLLGKTNMPEFGLGGNTRNEVYGVTANPYDLTKTCAGSSGGSGVALATGMAPLCTGTDTGGSLRNPAAYNGVVGFRTTPGVVPDPKRVLGLIPMSLAGPMARDVADAALMLSVISRPDLGDPFSTLQSGDRFAAPQPADLSSLRIAVTEDFGFAITEGIVRRAFQKRASAIAPLCGTAETASPDCTGADRLFALLRSMVMMNAGFRRFANTPGALGPNTLANIAEARSYSAADYTGALASQTAYMAQWKTFFDSWDYLISPAVSVSPRPWRELYPAVVDGQTLDSYYQWLSLAYASTIAGHPSITIPMGLDETGMPFGLQIIGRRHDDLGVLRVAAALETQFAGNPDLSRPGVDLEALAAARPLSEDENFYGFG
ncbi:amidase [Seohaeicola nanhaiensis]|uniref:Amidase n=1 Tax=Seohaeicola nanhaiensis TaxID=1387282 RepID=A0ABV9KLX9_9RHOB